MPNYYFVGSLLPELQIGQPVDISFAEFDRLLQMNLSAKDYERTKVLRRFWDLENLRSYWKKEPLDPHGQLNEKELEEALLNGEGLPRYVRSFLEEYENDAQRLAHFPRLMTAYYQEEVLLADGFLKTLLRFQREMRLLLVAWRAKKLGRNLEQELQFEDPEDPFVVQLLTYDRARGLELPEQYEPLRAIFNEHAEQPMALHQALCEYIFNTIDKMIELQPFSLDRILGYLVQLSLAEKWLQLDKAKGVEVVDRFVKEKA